MSDAAAALWKALCMEADVHPKRRGVKPKLKASEIIHQRLSDLGLIDIRVWANKGYWSHAAQDVFRWEFVARRIDFPSVSVVGGSYDSMTKCSKTSVRLEWLKDMHDGELCAVEVKP